MFIYREEEEEEDFFFRMMMMGEKTKYKSVRFKQTKNNVMCVLPSFPAGDYYYARPFYFLFFDDIVYMCVMGAAFVFTQAGIAPFIYFLIVIYSI